MENRTISVVKSLDDELKQATYVVMVPNEVDAHGDIASIEEVRKACHSFNLACRQANLFHLKNTESFKFAESYICPADIFIDERFVKKGTWLAVVQTVDDALWELQKAGQVVGLSIGALAEVEILEE